jgi:hypothetical protein
VSSYEITADRGLKLADPVAGSTGRGQKGLRDEAITDDGRYLYAIDPGAQNHLTSVLVRDHCGNNRHRHHRVRCGDADSSCHAC